MNSIYDLSNLEIDYFERLVVLIELGCIYVIAFGLIATGM